jgi:hypothetical protein
MGGADNLEREMLKTRVIVGAESAYFCAQSDARSMDVLLPAGKGAIAGLQQRIDEMQADVERRAARVAFLREALAAYRAS